MSFYYLQCHAYCHDNGAIADRLALQSLSLPWEQPRVWNDYRTGQRSEEQEEGEEINWTVFSPPLPRLRSGSATHCDTDTDTADAFATSFNSVPTKLVPLGKLDLKSVTYRREL